MKRTTPTLSLAFAAIALVLLIAACAPTPPVSPSPAVPAPNAANAVAPDVQPPIPSGTADGSNGQGSVAGNPAQPAQPPLAGKNGSLSVLSRPLNADIFVDGVLKGKSPLIISDLPYGTYVISASKQTYIDNNASVTLDKDLVYVELNLTDQATYARQQAVKDQPGDVVFTSSPTNAEVYFEGQLIGTTPLSKKGVAPGTYTFTYKKATYTDYTGQVTVLGGQSVKATGTLPEIKQPVSASP